VTLDTFSVRLGRTTSEGVRMQRIQEALSEVWLPLESAACGHPKVAPARALRKHVQPRKEVLLKVLVLAGTRIR
jgi:hypothetical protein